MDLSANGAGTLADIGLWIDWNNDGVFDTFLALDDVAAGTHVFSVTVPGNYVSGTDVYYRVRAFEATFNPVMADSRGFANNGEVEDRLVTTRPTAVALDGIGVGMAYDPALAALLGSIAALCLGAAALLLRRRSAG